MPMKITYATMSTDNEEMNAAYEQALESVKPRLGQDHGVIVDALCDHLGIEREALALQAAAE